MMPFSAMRFRQLAGGPPPGGFGTFDPANTYVSIVLSAGDMIATATEGGGFRTAHGQPAKAVGANIYAAEFEILATDLFVGVCDTLASLNPSDPGAGGSAGKFAMYSNYGSVFNPTFNSGFATYTVGDIIGVTAGPSGGNWDVKLYKNGTLITSASMNGAIALVPCFTTYFDANASAEIITDPSLMTYFGSYGADEGWEA